MADAIRDIVRPILPGMLDYGIALYVSDEDRAFAEVWLSEHEITGYDPFFVVHPGGKGKKRWGAENFATLADRVTSVSGARVVVAGGRADAETIGEMKTITRYGFDTLDNVTVGQMAAIIERCDMFVSGDTGPMHVAAALGRPIVAIFLSSNPSVYGPRGKYARVVTGPEGMVAVDDVMTAIWDILSIDSDMEK